MPRNGSGIYSLPAGQPVVTGTVIDSTVFNTFTADVATALTNSLAKNGETTPTQNIPMGTMKITGLGDATQAKDAMNRDASDARYARLGAANTFTGDVQIDATAPSLVLRESDAAADNRFWDFRLQSEQFEARVVNDAFGASATWMTVARTNNTVDSIALAATAITLNGVNITDYARLSQANTFAGAVQVSSVQPELRLYETDAAANNRLWGILAEGEQLRFRLIDDAVTTALDWLVVDRTANTRDSIALTATTVTVNGQNILVASSSLNASNLGSGTVPDARFPATLPAVSGANLTTLNAGNLASGTVPSARITSLDSGTTVNSALIGYRSIPRSTTTTTIAIGDLGRCIAVSAAIAIPASVFAAGDAISVYNDSASSINITIAAGTLRLAGTTSTGTRALAPRGLATLWFNVGGATPEVIASGAGVS